MYCSIRLIENKFGIILKQYFERLIQVTLEEIFISLLGEKNSKIE